MTVPNSNIKIIERDEWLKPYENTIRRRHDNAIRSLYSLTLKIRYHCLTSQMAINIMACT